MICNNCQKEISNEMSFCPYCGAKIEKEIVEENFDKPAKIGFIFGIVGLVLNVLSLFLFAYLLDGEFFMSFLTLGISIPAIVIGAKVSHQTKKLNNYAKNAFTLGIIGFCFGLIGTILLFLGEYGITVEF